ncbi:MAG: MarR family transcriptional regulator [Coriobacteriales bacterium]|jgi:DNA-binding MarR family transcriptional regulator|nr:MarR family transcriptional regulator [Coriobacteriales bacterium]
MPTDRDTDREHAEQRVIVGTIELIEKVANNRVEYVTLDDGQRFYRAESHVLAVIGEEPGIFGSEIARRFHVTRAAVQKTLGRLEERGLLRKETDSLDKKRIGLFLTADGHRILELLVRHQMRVNAGFFDAVSSMTAEELGAVGRFLSMAHDVLDGMQETR